jgi:hypothetical protein
LPRFLHHLRDNFFVFFKIAINKLDIFLPTPNTSIYMNFLMLLFWPPRPHAAPLTAFTTTKNALNYSTTLQIDVVLFASYIFFSVSAEKKAKLQGENVILSTIFCLFIC